MRQGDEDRREALRGRFRATGEVHDEGPVPHPSYRSAEAPKGGQGEREHHHRRHQSRGLQDHVHESKRKKPLLCCALCPSHPSQPVSLSLTHFLCEKCLVHFVGMLSRAGLCLQGRDPGTPTHSGSCRSGTHPRRPPFNIRAGSCLTSSPILQGSPLLGRNTGSQYSPTHPAKKQKMATCEYCEYCSRTNTPLW